MDKMRVLVVDDHTLFREGIVGILSSHEGVEVVGEAEDGLDAIEKARRTAPDVVLMDIYMPRCDGIEALARIKEENPDVKVVMLTASENDDKLFEAIERGAQGYLLKKISRRQLFEMLDVVCRGEAALTSDLMMKVVGEYARRRRVLHATTVAQEQLTLREREILSLIASGASDNEIADALSIAKSTVRFHVSNILEKLHLDNRVQAAAYAVEEGLFRRGEPDQATMA
jgi:DNA-binding NarL/FixJ family response regulator